MMPNYFCWVFISLAVVLQIGPIFSDPIPDVNHELNNVSKLKTDDPLNPNEMMSHFLEPYNLAIFKLLTNPLENGNVSRQAIQTRNDLSRIMKNWLEEVKKTSDNLNIPKTDRMEELEELERVEEQANLAFVEGINLMAMKNETLDEVLDDVLDPKE